MSATGTWRDRWKDSTHCGEVVLDVWERDGKPLAYQYAMHGNVLVSSMTGYLIPKPQPPRPKQYRPYTEAELWDVIQKAGGVLWVKRKGDSSKHIANSPYKQLVVSSVDPNGWFDYYTHLDGTPFGMEVEGE